MIYEPRSGALFADDGQFLKTVHCPMALRVSELSKLADPSPDKHCNTCHTTIMCADNWSDDDMRAALERDPGVCVFATSAAKNITVLKPIGFQVEAPFGLPVIRTARSIEAMDDGFRRGLRPLIKKVGPSSNIGSKLKVYQHLVTGEVWRTADYRREHPNSRSPEQWGLVADWFLHRPDWPFPLAAYLVPPELSRGMLVFLEDVIQDIPVTYWNQGDSRRLVSSVAMWNGFDFEVEDPNSAIDLAEIVG